MKKNWGSIVFILFVSLSIGIGLGQGCSRPFQSSKNTSGNNSSELTNSQQTNSEVNPNLDSLSLVYNKQVLDHFVSCSGVGLPSDETLSTWESKRGAISIDGTILTITAPMLMSVTTIASDVCRDLIDQEKISPRLFQGVDWSNPTLASDGAMNSAVKGLALSCWQRHEDDIERQLLVETIKSQFSAAPVDNSHAFLFMCTAMLSSLDAIIL